MGNQLNHVAIVSDKDTNIQIPDAKEETKSKDEERVRSPTSAKIAMFEKKEEVKPKPNRPTKRMNKKKVGALNSKFANLNINPAALKPNGKAKMNKVHRDDGVID